MASSSQRDVGQDSFGSKDTLEVGGSSYQIYRLDKVEGSPASCPYSLKILLENLLRTEDGANITADHIRALAAWDPTAEPDTEIQFTPARVVMQDFTGVPCVVDLATMREAVQELGGDPARINPLAPGRAGHRPLGDRRPVRGARTRSSATSSSSTSATPSATSSCAGARPRSTTSRSCRRAPGSCTRSTSSTWPASCSSGTAWPTRTPWSAPTRTPRWSTGSACSAGASAASRPRPRCSASRCRCSSRRSSASSWSASCPRAPPRPTWCSRSPRCCASTASSASSSSSTARASPRCRWPTAPPSAT